MLANVVKPGQEAAWDKAKQIALKQRKASDPLYWGLVMHLFKSMVEKDGSASAEELAWAYPEAEHETQTASTGPGRATCTVLLAYHRDPDQPMPAWIEVMPGGRFQAADGRGPFVVADAEEIVRASNEDMPEAGIVIDYDHSTDLAATEGRPAPAAGWIKRFKVIGGRIMAAVEWTKKALEALKAKEYRYISPVFEHDKGNRVERILRAALTNNPALTELPAIASRQQAMAKHQEMSLSERARRMEQAVSRRDNEETAAYHKRLMKHLALDDEEEGAAAGPPGDTDAAPEDDEGSTADLEDEAAGALKDWAEEEEGEPEHSDSVGDDEELTARHRAEDEALARRHDEELAACREEDMRSQLTARHKSESEELARKHDEELAAFRTAAARKAGGGLEHKAQPGGGEGKNVSDTGTPMKSRMSIQLVKHNRQLMNTVGKLIKRVDTLEHRHVKDVAVSKVDAAIRSGRLIPGHREWGIQYCSSDPKGFDSFLAGQPQIIASGPDGTFTGRVGAPSAQAQPFSSSALEILANMGLETDEQIERCAKVQQNWNLKFPRPQLRLDDSALDRQDK